MNESDIKLMTDGYGRRVTDVRIVLTNSCNLKCIYCHHEGEEINGCSRASDKSPMTWKQIVEILSLFEELGVKTVKLTGGEPMLRADLLEIISVIPKGIESSMTTNGTLLTLEKACALKKAGLKRVNISLDTLNPEKYKKITGSDHFDKVLNAIESAVKAGLTPVKINVVILPGINDDEIDDFLAFVRGRPELILQFIELMDMNGWTDKMDNSVHQYAEFVSNLEARFAGESKEIITRKMHHRRKYDIDGAVVEVVRPMHNAEFCANCNRLRITSDGFLKPCLLRTGNEVNISELHGADLKAAVAEAVSRRSPFFKDEP